MLQAVSVDLFLVAVLQEIKWHLTIGVTRHYLITYYIPTFYSYSIAKDVGFLLNLVEQWATL